MEFTEKVQEMAMCYVTETKPAEEQTLTKDFLAGAAAFAQVLLAETENGLSLLGVKIACRELLKEVA